MATWKKVVVESASNTIAQNTAGSAATLTSSRTISLGTDLSGSASFDGSADITIDASIASNAVDADALNVTGNGTLGQVLSSDGDGSFSWINASSGSLTGLSDTNISSPSGGHILVYDGTDSFDNVAMSGEGTLSSTGVFELAATIANNHTFSGNITVSGDLTVNGNTTTINTQTLTVEDKLIKLADVTSPTTTTANGGGIQIESSATEAEWPELKWNSGTELTGWTLSDHTTTSSTDFPVSVMQFGIAAPSSTAIETEAGAGAFFADTSNGNLYIYI
jgi:hypothetical protein